MKKKMLVCLSLILSLGINGSVSAANFSDINDVPWTGAVSYINDVADLGLMVGDTNSSGQKVFRARDNITYCEVAQLIYNLFKGSDSTMYATKWGSVLTGYKIPDWAKNATAYALENSILSISDLPKFMKNADTSNNATREDTALFFGRAFSKTNSVDTSASLSFNDAGSISSLAVPYIALLNKLNIIVGDSSNNFNPKNTINRAEMAVIVSKSYEVNGGGSPSSNTSNDNQVKGTVTKMESFNSTYILEVTSGGKAYGFIGDDDVEVVNGSKTVKFSTITKGDEVTVLYDGSKIEKVTITYDAENTDDSETKGTIYKLTSKVIEIKNKSGNRFEYDLEDEDVTVKLDGSSSDLDELMDLYDDDEEITAELTLNSKDEVTKIVATTDDEDSEYKGTITELDKRTIEIKSGSKRYEYDIYDTDITVKIDGKSEDLAELIDLFEDDEEITATLTVNSKDEVTKIVATTEDEDDEYKGKIYEIKKSYIEIKSGSKYHKYDIYDTDITVKIDGKTEDLNELIDVFDDDDDITVTLTVNSKDEVTKIVATTSDSDEEVEGTISSLSSSTLKLKSKSYDIDDEDDIDIDVEDGTRESNIEDFDKLKDAVSDNKKMEVTVVIKGGYVSEISGEVVEVEGDIYRIDLSSKIIKMDLKSDTYEYKYSTDAKVYLDDDKIDFGDLDDALDDDDLKAILTLEDGIVTKIEAETK